MYDLAGFGITGSSEIYTDTESSVYVGSVSGVGSQNPLRRRGPHPISQRLPYFKGSLAEEDYKLLGISDDEFLVLARPAADQYAAIGGSARFNLPASTLVAFIGSGVTPPAPPMAPVGAAAPNSTVVPTAAAGAVGPYELGRLDWVSIYCHIRGLQPLAASRRNWSRGGPGWLTAAGAEIAVERQVAHRLAMKRDQVTDEDQGTLRASLHGLLSTIDRRHKPKAGICGSGSYQAFRQTLQWSG